MSRSLSRRSLYPGFGRHFVWINVSTKLRLAFAEIRLAFTVKDAMKKCWDGLYMEMMVGQQHLILLWQCTYKQLDIFLTDLRENFRKRKINLLYQNKLKKWFLLDLTAISIKRSLKQIGSKWDFGILWKGIHFWFGSLYTFVSPLFS